MFHTLHRLRHEYDVFLTLLPQKYVYDLTHTMMLEPLEAVVEGLTYEEQLMLIIVRKY